MFKIMKKTKKVIAGALVMVMLMSLFQGIMLRPADATASGLLLKNPDYMQGSKVARWDCVYFGNYWLQDTNDDGIIDPNDEKQPIRWRVLSVGTSEATLLADTTIADQKYNGDSSDATWESCSLRRWLNTDFYNVAFNEDEKNAIESARLSTPGSNDTNDNVYLLTRDDVESVYDGFAVAKNRVSDRGWFLRDLEGSSLYSGNTNYVYVVDANTGSISSGKENVAHGVRPVIRIDIDSDSLISADEIYSDGVHYSVSYDANGGDSSSVPDSISVLCGNTYYVDYNVVPTREGYVFKGWSGDAEGTEKITYVTNDKKENVTLYAIWSDEPTAYDINSPGNKDNVTTWDSVLFGNYYSRQEDTSSAFVTEPIKWRVLTVSGDYALLLAEEGIDYKAYDDNNQSYYSNRVITWEDCSLRKWLNGTFYNTAFSDKEKAAVVTSTLVNEQYECGGNNTNDKVFLLSSNDVTNSKYGFETGIYSYSLHDNYYSRMTGASEYVKCYGVEPYLGDNYTWWLRSLDNVCSVTGRGTITSSSYSDRASIRPAVWIDLSKNNWKKTEQVKARRYYTVTYDANGGDESSVPDSQNAYYCEEYYVDYSKIPTKDNYVFVGWATDKEGKNRVQASFWYCEKSDMTLYAMWSEDNSTYELKAPRLKDADNITVWDSIYFGNYYQDSSNSKEKIKWRVLYVNGDDALLISDKLLGSYKADENYAWKESPIKNWLNKDFYNEAFNDEEKAAINKAEVLNDYSSDGKGERYTTWDYVNLLSYADVNTDKLIIPGNAELTYKAKRYDINGKYVYSYTKNDWWLRTNAYDSNRYVSGGSGYHYSYDCIGIRPVIHLDLSKAVWQNAGTVQSDILYTISYDANGGDASSVPNSYKVSSKKTYNVNYNTIPTREGYEFRGWASDKEGQNRALSSVSITPKGDTTWYAVWQDKNNPYSLHNPVTDSNGKSTWDKVYFGNYYMNNGEEKEPIKWRVLSVEGDDAYLLAEKALDYRQYSRISTTSASSSSTEYVDVLYPWLNSEFYNSAFNKKEKMAIKDTTVSNNYYRYTKVSDISLSDLKESYLFGNFTSGDVERVQETDYAKSILEKTKNDVSLDRYKKNMGWWIGHYYEDCYVYSYYSSTYKNETNYQADITNPDRTSFAYVRPAIHIDLSTMAWEHAYFNVNYDANGGDADSVPEPDKVEHGEEFVVNSDTVPTKEGYVFAGWSTDKEGINRVASKYIYTDMDDTTLYARWVKDSRYYRLKNPSTENNVSTWDCIYFGNYQQNDTNDDGVIDENDSKEGIKWRVLSVDGDEVLLMTDKAIDCRKYNDKAIKVSWKNSSLRTWLNNTFYTESFSKKEKQSMKDISSRGVSDKVTLLSVEDACNPLYGFVKDSEADAMARRAGATAYAEAKGIYINKSKEYLGNCYWWLRSDEDSNTAPSVLIDGSIVDCDRVIFSKNGIRPVIHVNLSSLAWKPAGNVTSAGESRHYVIYDANGGSEANVPDKEIVEYNSTYMVNNKVIPGKKGYIFAGWAFDRQGAVMAGTSFKIESKDDITLYAIWTKESKYIVNDPRVDVNGVTTWDCIEFGKYQQNDTDGDGLIKGDEPEPIKWRVLSIEGDEAYIMSDKAIAFMSYNDIGDVSVGWSDSSLRTWLNDTFYNAAFSKKEKSAIIETSTDSTNNLIKDNIYLLSAEEVGNASYGFEADVSAASDSRIVLPTGYASASKASGYYSSNMNTGNCSWWLRSSEPSKNGVSVRENGSIYSDGYVNTVKNAVRPVLHISLSSYAWKAAGAIDSKGENRYHIIYDANGGDEAAVPAQAMIKTGDTYTVDNSMAPVREGYIFKGWSIYPTGEEKVEDTFGYSAEHDTVLYAIWEEIVVEPSPTETPVAAATATPTPTPDETDNPTATATPTPSVTDEPTATDKPTATATPTPSATDEPAVTTEATAKPAPTPDETDKPEVTATPAPTPAGTDRPDSTDRPEATKEPSATAKPDNNNSSSSTANNQNAGTGQEAQTQGATTQAATTPSANDTQKQDSSNDSSTESKIVKIKISNVKCKKNSKKITGKVSVVKVKIKIIVNRKTYKNIKFKKNTFTLNLKNKLKKNDKITIIVEKDGYKKTKKSIKVK